MQPLALSPYFHPTTVCFVDDNQPFLDSLDLELPAWLIAKKFVHPADALIYLNQPPALSPLVDRCFSKPNLQQSPNQDSSGIHLDLSLIEQEVNQLQRFQRNSVLVVDYAMPSINGLELVEALDDPYLKVAMLTGVADEKIAVAAFNAGLLDRFVPKHGLGAVGNIMQYVAELQQEFFLQNTALLRNVLTLDPPDFLSSPQVAAYVTDLMQTQSLVEYYLVSEPAGLLLLTATGEMQRLVVCNNAQMDAQVQFAQANQAPQDVVDALKNRHKLGYFWDLPENYYGSESYPWDDHLLAATELKSTKPDATWFMAVSDDPPADIDFDPEATSYSAFLRQFYPDHFAAMINQAAAATDATPEAGSQD